MLHGYSGSSWSDHPCLCFKDASGLGPGCHDIAASRQAATGGNEDLSFVPHDVEDVGDEICEATQLVYLGTVSRVLPGNAAAYRGIGTEAAESPEFSRPISRPSADFVT